MLVAASLVLAAPVAVAATAPAARPSTWKVLFDSFFGPTVRLPTWAFGWRYGVDGYVEQVHGPGADGGGAVHRSSRPSALAVAATPELLRRGFRGLARPANPAALAEGYRALRARGVTFVVDLREEGDAREAEAAARTAGLGYANVKLKDNAWHVPPRALRAAVSTLQERVAAGDNVVVHCQRGRGRTGLVVSAYEATRHAAWTERDAIRYARGGGMYLLGQEHALRRFVRDRRSR